MLFKATLFQSDTAGALLDWCGVGPVMGSPVSFPHYYHCTETVRITQVVVMLWTEHAGSHVFVVSVFTLGPSNWGKWSLLLTQLKTAEAGDGKRSLWGTLFVVMGLAWFLSQHKMKSADKQTHLHTKMHTHTHTHTHTYYTLTSCLSHEAPLLFCQLNKHTAAKPTSPPTLSHNPLRYS